MSAKRLIISILAAFVGLLTVSAVEVDSTAVKRFDKRVRWHYDGWERLKPKTVTLQYAGGMGLAAGGVGWQYGRRDRASTELLVGFLPRHYGNEFRLTFTLKESFEPWSIRCCPWLAVEPLTCGAYVTTITGEEFWGSREPKRYPKHYYNFASRLRLNVFLGQQVSFYTRNDVLRQVSAYYELSTNEIYLLSRATNSYLRPRDYLRFSFGIRVQICKPIDR